MRGAASRFFQRISVDAIGFVLIAALVILPRLPFLHHAHGFNDSSWYFHYGRRVLAGDVPYRDFVFQVGPIAIYVDALFQWLFGDKLVASYCAALAIHTLRVFAMWALVRRLAGGLAAALLTLYCAFDISFGFAHHWSWAYAQLFMTLSALCFVSAARADTDRPRALWLGLAGLCAGLVVSSRQATAVAIAALLAVATAALVLRDRRELRRAVPIWIGLAAALVLVLGALAAIGALGPGVQQIFLDAPQKKSAGSLRSVLDALSGGALTTLGESWHRGLVRYLALPLAVTALVLALARLRPASTVSAGAVGAALIPGALACGLLLRFANLELNDVVRSTFLAATALAVLSPRRFEAWLGIEPLLGVALIGIPLASDLAVELSFPGRGWTDITSLICGAVCMVLASSRVSARAKTALCGAFALCGLVHAGWYLYADRSPFALHGASDGPRSQVRFALPGAIFEDLEVGEPRMRATAWLRSQVPPGSTCFLYGTNTLLYDALACRNPTRIDTTIPDFITVGDADEALAVLRAEPPDFLISQELSLGNVPLTFADAHWDSWKDLNQPAGLRMHGALRELLSRYEEVGFTGDVLGPALSAQAAATWDNMQSIRLYRRRR